MIKIEAHQGNERRYVPPTLKGETRMFLGANRTKQGVVQDVKREAARDAIYKLTKSADVAVENFRPGVSDRLQIGYQQLSAIDPHLVYCAISSYGSRGPMPTRPGFEQVLQAMRGIAVSQWGQGCHRCREARW